MMEVIVMVRSDNIDIGRLVGLEQYLPHLHTLGAVVMRQAQALSSKHRRVLDTVRKLTAEEKKKVGRQSGVLFDLSSWV